MTVIPVVVRTATRTLRHPCGECGQPIRRGEQYEEHKLPPGGELGYHHWQRMVLHWPSRFSPRRPEVTGCDLVAAYEENLARDTDFGRDSGEGGLSCPIDAGRDAGKPPSPAEVRLAHSQWRPPPAGKGALSRPAYVPGGSHA